MPKKEEATKSFDLWYLVAPSTHNFVFGKINPKIQYTDEPRATSFRHNFELYESREKLMKDFLNWTLRTNSQEAYFGKITVSPGQKVRLKALMDICEE